MWGEIRGAIDSLLRSPCGVDGSPGRSAATATASGSGSGSAVQALHALLRRGEGVVGAGGAGGAAGRALASSSSSSLSSWVLLLVEGYLAIASVSKDIVRMNAEKKAGGVFQDAMQWAVRGREGIGEGTGEGIGMLPIFELACLIAKYHYEAAVGVAGAGAGAGAGAMDGDGGREGSDDAATTRRGLYHGGEAVRYGEIAIEYSRSSNALEATIEIRTMLHHARVLQADCMVSVGQLVEAARVLGALPDWSKAREHAVWYGEELLVKMRLGVASRVVARVVAGLRGVGAMLRDAREEDFGAADRAFLAKRLGRVLEAVMRWVGGTTGGKDGDVDGEASLLSGRVDVEAALLGLVEAAPDVGVEALLVVVDGLQRMGGNNEYRWAGILCDVMRMGSVCGYVRGSQSSEGGRDVVGSLQMAAARTFVGGDLGMSIAFSQLVMQYGPESKVQWATAMLYALHVYAAYASPGRSDREGGGLGSERETTWRSLDGETRAHPFVMMVRLFELRALERDVIPGQSGDDRRLIEDIVAAAAAAASGDPRHRQAWTREYLCALKEIDPTIDVPGADDISAVDGVDAAVRVSEGADAPLELFLRAAREAELRAADGRGLVAGDLEGLVEGFDAAWTDAMKRQDACQSNCHLWRKVVGGLETAVSLFVHSSTALGPDIETIRAVLRLTKKGLVAMRASTCDVFENVIRDLESVHCNVALQAYNAAMADCCTETLATGKLDRASLVDLRAALDEIMVCVHEPDMNEGTGMAREERSGPDLATQDLAAIELAAFSYGLASGDFEAVHRLSGDFDAVSQHMGEDFFLEYISVSLRMWGVGAAHTRLLQYVVDTVPGGFESILMSVAMYNDHVGPLVAYSIYATAIQRLVNVPPSVGQGIMVTEEASARLAVKVCHLEPWKYSGYICEAWEQGNDEEGASSGGEEEEEEEEEEENGWEEEEEDGEAEAGGEGDGGRSGRSGSDDSQRSESIENGTTRSLQVPSRAHSHEDVIESPPTATRKRKLSAAGHIISGLIGDLAPSSSDHPGHHGGEARAGEPGEQPSPWLRWIKRVFSP